MITQTALARAWGVSQPAIAKLVKRGMPLDSEEDARKWKLLHGQRKDRADVAHAPKSKTGPLPSSTTIPKASPPSAGAPGDQERSNKPSVSSGIGAEHALARLESEEMAAYDELQLALAEQREPPEGADKTLLALNAKFAREAWLKVSESLRKYDLLVEASRRDSGQLIPRVESEVACELGATWLRLAVRTFISSGVPRIIKAGNDPAAIVRLIEDGMGAALETSILRSAKCRTPLQSWAIAALRRGFGQSEGTAAPDLTEEDDAG